MNASVESGPHGSSDWESCPQGEIGDLVLRLRAQRRQERVQAIGVAGAAAALVIAVGLVVMQRSAEEPGDRGILAGGIWCSDFQNWSSEFMAGTLDAGRSRQMEAHLAECEHCRQKLLELRNPSATPSEADVTTGGQETVAARHIAISQRTLASR